MRARREDLLAEQLLIIADDEADGLAIQAPSRASCDTVCPSAFICCNEHYESTIITFAGAI